MPVNSRSITVLLPCYNEATTIAMRYLDLRAPSAQTA
jgi:hypothetical protein